MDGIKVGTPLVEPDAPTHVTGVSEGNHGPMEKQPGHLPDGRSTARRSTGINPRDEDPVVPGAPNLSPP